MLAVLPGVSFFLVFEFLFKTFKMPEGGDSPVKSFPVIFDLVS